MPMIMTPNVCSPDANFTEKAVFKHIQATRSDETYYCFHSVGISKHERKEYSECDFVILGPRGIYCVEVKGGAIHREGGVWRVGTGERGYTSTEGPFQQAESAKWSLLKWLEKSNVIDRRDTVFGWGVAFPSVIFTERDPSWDQDVIYDLRDTERSFAEYLRRLEIYHSENLKRIGRIVPKRLEPHRIENCANALRKNFTVGLSLRGLVIEGRKEVARLSREQFRVLDFVLRPQNPRLMCAGGPGTGKTLVAMEAAERMSAEGSNVLFVCYNSELAAILQLRCRKRGGRYRISTLHQFMGKVIAKAGLSGTLPTGANVREHFEEVYPDLFEKACELLLEEGELPEFDAVVVDEAQDLLNQRMIDCLSLVLSGGMEQGRWAIFYDPTEQAQVYRRFDAMMLESLAQKGAVSVELEENFRNPKKVAGEAYAFSNSAAPECRRELDSSVEYKIVSNEKKAAAKLRALLVELVRDGISPSDIAILSYRKAGDRLVDRFPPDIGKDIRSPRDVTGGCDAFQSCSVPAFKGLEAEIVIVTDVPDSLDDDWRRSLFLVALTRTRTKCFVLASRPFIQNRTERLMRDIGTDTIAK